MFKPDLSRFKTSDIRNWAANLSWHNDGYVPKGIERINSRGVITFAESFFRMADGASEVPDEKTWLNSYMTRITPWLDDNRVNPTHWACRASRGYLSLVRDLELITRLQESSLFQGVSYCLEDDLRGIDCSVIYQGETWNLQMLKTREGKNRVDYQNLEAKARKFSIIPNLIMLPINEYNSDRITWFEFYRPDEIFNIMDKIDINWASKRKDKGCYLALSTPVLIG
jgi:hypothetical protein